MFTSAEKLKALLDVKRVLERRKKPVVVLVAEEPSTERDLVRRFGAKVASVRWSRRADFVGLLVMGKSKGFFVTANAAGERMLRKVSVVCGKLKVMPEVIKLRNEDSVTNLQPGLLKWVQ